MKISNVQNLKIDNKTSKKVKQSNKIEHENKSYVDPLQTWPVKGLAFSNEVGAIVGEVSPKFGTLLWVPALMYMGADIYDKYKNDEQQYNPSVKRGIKQAIFQVGASVMLPTLAIDFGHNAISGLNKLSKTGLSINAKQKVWENSLNYMQNNSLNLFEKNADKYVNGFKDGIKSLSQESKTQFKVLNPFKKVLTTVNPLKAPDSMIFSNENKLVNYAGKQAEKILTMRSDLMKNVKPKGMSRHLFKKFQNLQVQYKELFPDSQYMGKAAKQILKDYHNSQILKNKMLKTAGGIAFLILLLKPIDKFVENIVIKKAIEPGLDAISNKMKKTDKI